MTGAIFAALRAGVSMAAQSPVVSTVLQAVNKAATVYAYTSVVAALQKSINEQDKGQMFGALFSGVIAAVSHNAGNIISRVGSPAIAAATNAIALTALEVTSAALEAPNKDAVTDLIKSGVNTIAENGSMFQNILSYVLADQSGIKIGS